MLSVTEAVLYHRFPLCVFSDNTSQDIFPVPALFIMMPFIVADIPEFGSCITHMPYDIGIFRPDFYRCSV